MATKRSIHALEASLRLAKPSRVLRCGPQPRLACASPILGSRAGATAAPHHHHSQLPAPRWYSVKANAESKDWKFNEVVEQLVKKSDKDIVFVDVREPAELHETGKIPGAINIPITTAIQSFHHSPEDFRDMYGFEQPGKDQELVFYCKAGVRAKAAAGLARHAGWNKVGVYYGSWLDWQKENGPVEPVKKGDTDF